MAARTFSDSFGVIWNVFEVEPTSRSQSQLGPAHDGWLTFLTGEGKRRLSDYPEGWWALADSELDELRLRATPATPINSLAALPPRSAVPQVPGTLARTVADEVVPAVAERNDAADLTLAERIRHHGREARAAGVPVLEGMIQLSRILDADGIRAGSAEFKRARHLFVQTFYFE